MVTINAYIGKFKKHYLLDDSYVGSVPKSAYKQILAPLFQTLASYNAPGGGDAMQPQGGVNPASPYNAQSQASAAAQPAPGNYQDFVRATNEKYEKLAIAGFVISIVGLLLSFVGYTYGIVLYILEFYFASCGIRTKKKGFAIATFVLAGLSVLILLGTIFLYALVA